MLHLNLGDSPIWLYQIYMKFSLNRIVCLAGSADKCSAYFLERKKIISALSANANVWERLYISVLWACHLPLLAHLLCVNCAVSLFGLSAISSSRLPSYRIAWHLPCEHLA